LKGNHALFGILFQRYDYGNPSILSRPVVWLRRMDSSLKSRLIKYITSTVRHLKLFTSEGSVWPSCLWDQRICLVL